MIGKFDMTQFLFRLLLGVVLVASAIKGTDALADTTIPFNDIPGASDNPLLKRYDGSFIISYKQFAYTDFVAPLSPLKRSADKDERDSHNNRVYRPEKQIELEGKLARIVYLLPEQRSPLEVLRNFGDVVAEAGGEVVFECKQEKCGGNPTEGSSGGGGDMSLMNVFFYPEQLEGSLNSHEYCALQTDIDDQRYFTAKMPTVGGDAYVTVHTFVVLTRFASGCTAFNGRSIALVHVYEPKAREKKMVLVDAANMAQSLSEQGSVSLYGILFDFDKADVKPESRPALDEIAKLMKADPNLAIIVVGHTDNKGSFDYNIDLSSRRALSVKNELMSAYGVNAERLMAAGAGMMAPVASNDNDEGRAKNRRVELVKLN
jgi:OmpA-OmpF porin, OOP family